MYSTADDSKPAHQEMSRHLCCRSLVLHALNAHGFTEIYRNCTKNFKTFSETVCVILLVCTDLYGHFILTPIWPYGYEIIWRGGGIFVERGSVMALT